MRWRGLGFFIISCFMCSVCSAVLQVEPSNPYPGGGTLEQDCPMTNVIDCNTHAFLPNCQILESTKEGPDENCYSSCQICAVGYVKTPMIKPISYGTSEKCVFRYNGCSCTSDSCGTNKTCSAGECVCAAGYEPITTGSLNGETVTRCNPCGVGYYKSQSGNTKCQPCPEGEYSDRRTMGSTSCSKCDKGSYNDKKGQTGCTKCPNDGTTDDTGAKSITDCYIPKDSDYVSFEDEYGFGTLTIAEDCYATD